MFFRQNNSQDFNTNAKYTAKPEFLKVIQSVEGVDNTQAVFHYQEVS